MSRKRSRLPAGIRKLKDGRLQVRVTRKDPLTQKRKDTVQTLPAHTTVAEAVILREEMLANLTYQVHHDAPPTLSDFCASWMRQRVSDLAESTAYTDATILGQHILPVFGELRIDQLNRGHLRSWREELNALIKKDLYSRRTVRGWWRLALQLMRDAFAEYQLADPTHRIKQPGGKFRPRREQGTLSRAQVKSLVDAAMSSNSDYRVLIALLAYTGMRRGEVIGLMWEDVNITERNILVRYSATYQAQNWSLKGTKTTVVRPAMMPMPLAKILGEWRLEMVKSQHKGLQSGLVVPSPTTGGFASHNTLRQTVKRAGEKAGIEQRVTPQVLRRTVNTLTTHKLGEVAAQTLVGHEDKEMTIKYLNLRYEQVRDYGDRVWGSGD